MGIDDIQFLRRPARGILIGTRTARDAFQAAMVAGQANVHRYQRHHDDRQGRSVGWLAAAAGGV